ncbi:MAG: metallophosphoesterase family protein [Chloroflexi bacterium]|nr:metallophosphoesterase family protein [Chloroflexota bacterium]
MRFALISDIHGNSAGLVAALTHLTKLGFDALYVLGDIRGGVGTDQVLDLLVRYDAHLIRGNAEEALFDVDAFADQTTDPARVRRNVEWCHTNLSAAHLDLLRDLPIQETIEIAPHRKIFLCHAAPNNVWSRTCEPTTPSARLRQVYGPLDAKVVVYGHYHGHHVIALDGKLLINVAGVGIGNGLSAITLLEYDGRWIVQQHQIPYND